MFAALVLGLAGFAFYKFFAASGASPAASANVLRAFAFVAAEGLALPGLAIALYLYSVGRVAGSGRWFQAIFELMFSGFVILPFVLLGCVFLLVAGLFEVVRPWACLALVLVNVGAVTVAWTISPPTEAGDLWIWVPMLLSLAIASALGWQAFRN